MPGFSFESYEKNGKRRKGVIEADSYLDAKYKLREQGVVLLKLSQNPKSKDSYKLSEKQLIEFTTLLSSLISAGLPLYESLIAIQEEVKLEAYHRVIQSLAEKVKSGSSLSDAMNKFPDSFDNLYTSLISAAEATGSLDVVLEQVLEYLKKRAKLKKQIFSALTYPAILAVFALIVIALLMGFVVPSIEGVFEGRALNGFTTFVLKSSQFFRSYWWLLLLFISLLAYLTIKILKSESGKRELENLLMKIPLIKTLLVESALVRFTRTLSSLLAGGLTLIEALSLSRKVMQNFTLENEIELAEKKILAGGSLSSELKKSKWIPSVATQMIAVGEESGRLSQMVQKIAEMYEEELEKKIEQTMTLIQPAILIIMGAIIGVVLMAILLPMADISSLTES